MIASSWSNASKRVRRCPILMAVIAALILGLGVLPKAALAASRPISVFAAASLQTALGQMAQVYTARTGVPVRLTFGSSPAMARQIQQGAPADIMISADTAWMDALQTGQWIDPASRTDLISNRLVLIVPAGKGASIALSPVTKASRDLARILGPGRLAMADPQTVPAGRYGKAALEKLGLWDGVSGQIAPTDTVRTALGFVARGEAPLGLVYASDAVAEPKVAVVATLPKTSHPKIVYPGAVTRNAQSPKEAKAFLTWLKGSQARALFLKNGFSPLD